jgi:glycosyltransferase involved in cell wall biosynthesis
VDNALKLAIDASNISSGGGLTHLVQMLNAVDPVASRIHSVDIWTSKSVAEKLPVRDWMITHSPFWCNSGLTLRAIGQQLLLPLSIKKIGCQILFSPGGTIPSWSSTPVVTMSQNMLPFSPDQVMLFGRWSVMRFKMNILTRLQGRAFRKSQGIVFLTEYAQNTINSLLEIAHVTSTVISHGVEERFYNHLKIQGEFNVSGRPVLRLLYVSIQMPYKHHIEVIDAVVELRRRGILVELQMAGGGFGFYGQKVKDHCVAVDPDENYIHNLGHVSFEELHILYAKADIFIFASSCENLPNILIEAMASGLPIACSDKGPMPEVLGDAGLYFNPESVDSIAGAIEALVKNPELRKTIASKALDKAQIYSWENCARETMSFLTHISENNS